MTGERVPEGHVAVPISDLEVLRGWLRNGGPTYGVPAPSALNRLTDRLPDPDEARKEAVIEKMAGAMWKQYTSASGGPPGYWRSLTAAGFDALPEAAQRAALDAVGGDTDG